MTEAYNRTAWDRQVAEPLCFSHSLEDQIGGQLAAGFSLTALEEAHGGADETANPIADRRIMPKYIATRAIKALQA